MPIIFGLSKSQNTQKTQKTRKTQKTQNTQKTQKVSKDPIVIAYSLGTVKDSKDLKATLKKPIPFPPSKFAFFWVRGSPAAAVDAPPPCRGAAAAETPKLPKFWRIPNENVKY